MKFNESQSRATAHKTGPMMVLAGPGSGKTTVITGRTCNLIKQGIPASSILVVTFTKAAAREMKERFLHLMNLHTSQVTFGTFHGVFYGILRHTYHLSGQNILSEDMKMKLLRELVDTYCQDTEDEADLLANLSREISTVKDGRINLSHYYSACLAEEVFRKIFEEYQGWLNKNKKLDFDDIMVWTYKLFRKRPDILKLWQDKFQYILIDEFQDINPIQYDIIRMLASPRNNLFIVGDDDQSIYRFRGAKPELMLNFPKDYPDAVQVTLDTNYRSTGEIVKKSGLLIGENESRFSKKIRTNREDGDKIDIHIFENDREEVAHMIESIREYLKTGHEYRDIAILFRTNIGSRKTVEQLMAYNMPFQMRDGLPNLYEHWVARDVFTYMRMSKGSRLRSDFLRVANKPNRYLARDSFLDAEVTFESLYQVYEERQWMWERIEKLEHDLKVLGPMTPFGALNYIRYGIGYEGYLKEYAQYRRIKPEELLEILDELQDTARGFDRVEDWFDHIERYKEELKRQNQTRQKDLNGITVSTLHSIKGLEFDNVYILDVNEGVIPYRKAVLDADVEEERRMFYVGMTRAKNRLHLYAVQERHDKKAEISRFLQEIVPSLN
ncbi:MAG TPA: ATP-dependent helicase [Candidatus Pelethocola excrementipullorum]|nr:ATP-dependent helicase [Candidatus Pelethocola excrementipullorum]